MSLSLLPEIFISQKHLPRLVDALRQTTAPSFHHFTPPKLRQRFAQNFKKHAPYLLLNHSIVFNYSKNPPCFPLEKITLLHSKPQNVF